MSSLTFHPILKKGQDLSTFKSFYQIILDYEDEFIQVQQRAQSKTS